MTAARHGTPPARALTRRTHLYSRWILVNRSICTRRQRQGRCTRLTMGQAPGAHLADPPQVGGETVHRRASRSLALGLLLVLACGPGSSAQPAARPSPTPVPVSTLDPGQVSRGGAVFGQHCASCHGAEAQGAPDWQRPDARGDLPAPPHDDTGHTWRHSDAQLSEKTRNSRKSSAVGCAINSIRRPS